MSWDKLTSQKSLHLWSLNRNQQFLPRFVR